MKITPRYWLLPLLAVALLLPVSLGIVEQRSGDSMPQESLGDWPVVLTVADVQRVLRISRGAAYHLCRSGRLRAVRVGKSIRVPRQALVDFLRDRTNA